LISLWQWSLISLSHEVVSSKLYMSTREKQIVIQLILGYTSILNI
jgi:hypothetical protein